MTGYGINLAPGERFIVQLAAGKQITQAAAICGMTSKEAITIATEAGWPDIQKIMDAAKEISREGTGVTPSDTTEPDQASSYNDGLEAPGDSVHGIFGALADSQAAIDRDKVPGARATLSMPLGRIVDADGLHEVVIGRAIVEVELHPAGVLAALSGDDIGQGPVSAYVSAEITDEGRQAIAALASLLAPGEPDGDGNEESEPDRIIDRSGFVWSRVYADRYGPGLPRTRADIDRLYGPTRIYGDDT